MTPARFVVPGTLHMLTVRTIKRMFFLVPRPRVVELVRYVFALAVEKHGVAIHEVMFMSNHFHVLLTDTRGVLPDFVRDLNSLLARGLNSLHGFRGSVIESGYQTIEVTQGERAIEHAVYILANPVKARLVERAKQWPGASTLAMRYGETTEFARPNDGLWGSSSRSGAGCDAKREAHRGKPSSLPESVSFTLVRPPVMLELDDATLRAEVRRQLEETEETLKAMEGPRVAGVRRVLTQQPTDMPKTCEAWFGSTPRVSGRSKWSRIAALQRRTNFLVAYAEAKKHFVAGLRDIVWPIGTWLMRVRFDLPCAGVLA